MYKKRLRIAFKVLGAVKKHFPHTKNFIEDMIDKQCQKEKISLEGVTFFTSLEAKKLAQKNIFFFCSEYVRGTL